MKIIRLTRPEYEYLQLWLEEELIAAAEEKLNDSQRYEFMSELARKFKIKEES